MHLHIPVWLWCFIYPMCVSCLKYGEEKELVNRQLQHTKEETSCNITITHRSASYLMIMFNKIDPDVAHFKLKFPESSVVNAKDEAIQPFRWIWTFQSDDRNVPFLQWGLDYATLSFGLLNAKALPETLVEFEVRPANCSITIGNRKSNLEIAYAFSNMTHKYLNSIDFQHNNDYVDNRNHSWCFAAERPLIKGLYQYNCCYSYYDFVNEEIIVNCSDDWIHDKSRMFSLLEAVPLILGYIILCYFPIPILDIVSSMSGKDVCNGYMSLDDDLTSDIVYMDEQSPITLSSIIYESCCKRCPQISSKFCGVIFIICLPVLIYIQLILYYIRMKDTTLELIKHGTSLWFLTILGGYEISSELFMPLFGGPWVMIILFYLAGIIFVVVPHKAMGNVLENALINPKLADKHPLFLGYNSLQLFSHMKTEDKCVYGRLKSVLIARFFCILNPNFWCHVYRVCFNTGERCLTYLRTILPKPLFCFLFLIMLPIRLLRFIIELSLCFLYYGLPFHFVLMTSYVELPRPFISWIVDISGVMRTPLRVLLIGLVYVVVAVLQFYFFWGIILIFCDSARFVLEVLFYLFMAVLVYPSTAFVYVSFCIVLLYYLFKQIRGIGDVYFDLLSDIVKSLSVLKAETNELRVVISYKDRIPGIPRELFLYVVKTYRPIFFSVFKAILPIILVIMLMPVTIQIISFTSNDSSTVTEVMKVIFIVLIGAIPRAVEFAFSASNKPVLKEVFLKKLEATILEYSKLLVETRSSDDPGLENVVSA